MVMWRGLRCVRVIGVFLLIIGGIGLNRILCEFITPTRRDELAGELEDFVLTTRSEVRKIQGFEKELISDCDGWKEYLFTKAVQMNRRGCP